MAGDYLVRTLLLGRVKVIDTFFCLRFMHLVCLMLFREAFAKMHKVCPCWTLAQANLSSVCTGNSLLLDWRSVGMVALLTG